MIPYPHRSSLECHVSNENTCRWCALEFDGIHNVPLDYSGRAKGKVEVLGSISCNNFLLDEILHNVLVRVRQRGELSFLLFFSRSTRVSRLVKLLCLRRDDIHGRRVALSRAVARA